MRATGREPEYGWVLAVAQAAVNGDGPPGEPAEFIRLEAGGIRRLTERCDATHVETEPDAHGLKQHVADRDGVADDEALVVLRAGPPPKGAYALDVRADRNGLRAEMHTGWVWICGGRPRKTEDRAGATAFADRASAEYASDYVAVHCRTLARDERLEVH